ARPLSGPADQLPPEPATEPLPDELDVAEPDEVDALVVEPAGVVAVLVALEPVAVWLAPVAVVASVVPPEPVVAVAAIVATADADAVRLVGTEDDAVDAAPVV